MQIDKVSLDDALEPYIIAEMSGNHGNAYVNAESLLVECKRNGANAFKLQTYTPDSMTLNCSRHEYIVGKGPWEGQKLYDLYSQGQTPASWLPDLFQTAKELGISIFSTPFSPEDVDILESINVSAYKIASFEITYIQLLKYIGQTGKPVIFSTGLATLDEIQNAYQTLREAGASEVAILKCSTSYPAPLQSLNLLTIQHLRNSYGAPVGFSDHTIGHTAAITAVALGATILEKHVKLDDDKTSVDASFSLPVSELSRYVEFARNAAIARGKIQDGPTEEELPYMRYRRSIVANRQIKEGEIISMNSIRIVRPAIGAPPSSLEKIIGMKAKKDIEIGEGITLEIIS